MAFNFVYRAEIKIVKTKFLVHCVIHTFSSSDRFVKTLILKECLLSSVFLRVSLINRNVINHLGWRLLLVNHSRVSFNSIGIIIGYLPTNGKICR